MLKGFDKNGNVKNVIVSEDGELLVKESGNSGGDSSSNLIETTLMASYIDLGIEALNMPFNGKVTQISVANYSETAYISFNLNESSADMDFLSVAPNIVVDLPINRNVTSISAWASEDNTPIYFVIKGLVEKE